MPASRPARSTVVATILVALGLVAIVVTFVARTGWGGYGLGLLLLAGGAGTLIGARVRRWRLAVGAGAAVVVLALGITAVGVTQVSGASPAWAAPDDFELDDARRVGELLIFDGVARDLVRGEVAWSVPGADEGEPVHVDPDTVVVQTADGLVAVDPSDGSELWRSPERGYGVAFDGGTLAVGSDDRVVGLDLPTGEVRWERDGQPATGCALGHSSGAPSRTAPALPDVLLLAGGEGSSTNEVLAVSDGSTVVPLVECSFPAAVTADAVTQAAVDDLRVATFIGLSVTDGAQAWVSDPLDSDIEEVWEFRRSGTALVEERPDGASVLDTATGEIRRTAAPGGSVVWLAAGDPLAASWGAVVVDGKPAVWNPVTDQTVVVPGAARVSESSHGGDWLGVDGTTADVTGQEAEVSWLVSPEGEVFGPFSGRLEGVGDGVVATSTGVHPVG